MRHLLVDHLRHKLFCPQRAFAQKVLRGAKQVRYWERGRPRPHRSHAQFLKIWRFKRSRFALFAGEGARAPSDDGLIPTQIDPFLGKAPQRCLVGFGKRALMLLARI